MVNPRDSYLLPPPQERSQSASSRPHRTALHLLGPLAPPYESNTFESVREIPPCDHDEYHRVDGRTLDRYLDD